MRKFKDLALSIVALLVSYGVYRLSAHLLSSIDNEFLVDFLVQLVFAIMIFLSVLVLKKTWIYRPNMRKMKVGWTAALVLLLSSAGATIQAIDKIPSISVTGVDLVLFLAKNLLIGFCEESLFRGLIQNSFHDIFGEDDTPHVFLGVICGAFCFGAMHLTNALKPEVSFSGAAAQAMFTFCTGILLATVYFRTGKNLWIVAFLHGINDVFAYIAAGRLSGLNAGEAVASSTSSLATGNVFLQVLVTFCLFSAISLFLLRPKKLRQLQEL